MMGSGWFAFEFTGALIDLEVAFSCNGYLVFVYDPLL